MYHLLDSDAMAGLFMITLLLGAAVWYAYRRIKKLQSEIERLNRSIWWKDLRLDLKDQFLEYYKERGRAASTTPRPAPEDASNPFSKV